MNRSDVDGSAVASGGATGTQRLRAHRAPARGPLTGRRSSLVAFVLLMAAVLLPVGATPAGAQRTADFVVVIATATGLSDLPSSVLRMAFLGLRAEHRGVRLVPLNLPLKAAARERMDRALLGLEPDQVGSFWVDQRVRDGRTPPRTVPSAELAVRIVAQLPGAIACVPAATFDSRVRALSIDGKAPSDSGYLLAR